MKKIHAIQLMILTGFTVFGTPSLASIHNDPAAEFSNQAEMQQVVERLESFMQEIEKDLAFISPDLTTDADSFEMEVAGSMLRLEAHMLVLEEEVRYRAAEPDPESDRMNRETEAILERLHEQHEEIGFSLRYMAPKDENPIVSGI